MKRFILKFLAPILIISSCNMTNKDRITEKLNTEIDSLKEIYAPDTRIALWNIELTNKNDSLKLSAEFENTEAADALKKLLDKKYAVVNYKIKVLPEKGQDRIVHALVNNSVASIRSKPKHSAELVNQAFLGTPVKVFKKERNWYLIQTPNKYIGWINEDDIVFFNKEELAKYKNLHKIIYNKQFGTSYSEPNTNSLAVSDLVIGCILPVIESDNRFLKVRYPDGREAYIIKNETVDMMTVFNRSPEKESLTETAEKFNGIPYLWGGFSSKAIDCSGFTSTVYFLNGVILQRDASQQIKYGTEVTDKFEYKDLQVGDLLFFTGIDLLKKNLNPKKVTHVGMYIGNAEFIHASGKVKITSMDSAKTNFESEYKDTFIKAMRIIGNVGTKSIEKITSNKFYKTIIPNPEK